LVARLVEGGVELKCKRCRRLLVVPLEGAEEMAVQSAQRSKASAEAPQKRGAIATGRGS
jgi:hypothetical protein